MTTTAGTVDDDGFLLACADERYDYLHRAKADSENGHNYCMTTNRTAAGGACCLVLVSATLRVDSASTATTTVLYSTGLLGIHER